MCLWRPSLFLWARLLLHDSSRLPVRCPLVTSNSNVLFSWKYIFILTLPVLVNDACYSPFRNVEVKLLLYSQTLCQINHLIFIVCLFIWCLEMLVHCVLKGMFLTFFAGHGDSFSSIYMFITFFLLSFWLFVIALEGSFI